MAAITIGRLDSHYRLPSGPQPPAALRARLDRTAREHLAGAVDAVAATLPEAGSGEVWVVRDLHVTVDLDTAGGVTPPAVAGAWSQRLVLALRQALAAGGEAGGVVRFPSRAAWTARFVAALAAGTAWERWELRAFSSLRALPPGRAMAEAIVRHPEDAAATVVELAGRGDLELVLLALGPADARRVVDALAPAGTVEPAAGRELARELAGLRTGRHPRRQPHLLGAALRLLAAALRSGVPLPRGAADVAAAMVVLGELVAGAGDTGQLAGALAAGRWGATLRLAGRRTGDITGNELAAVELLATLGGGDPCWLAELAADLGPAGPPAPREGIDVPVVATPYGGLLLLWPTFVQAWPAGLDDASAPEAAGTLRVLVASRLFGARHRDGLLRDPVLPLLCGLEHPPSPERIEGARAAAPVAPFVGAAAGSRAPDRDFFGAPEDAIGAAADRFAAGVLARFAAKLPGFAASSPAYVVRNFLDVHASLRLGTGTWTAAVTSPPLQLVLHMAGMSTLRYELPWAPAPVTVEVGWT